MKDLVKIIKENPGCWAVVDNDSWFLYAKYPESWERMSEEDRDEWLDGDGLLACDGEVKALGDGGYGSGHCYGGDILQALAAIVGVKIESV